eukprot:310341-Pelagomonas_calceolata.AAC.1
MPTLTSHSCLGSSKEPWATGKPVKKRYNAKGGILWTELLAAVTRLDFPRKSGKSRVAICEWAFQWPLTYLGFYARLRSQVKGGIL